MVHFLLLNVKCVLHGPWLAVHLFLAAAAAVTASSNEIILLLHEEGQETEGGMEWRVPTNRMKGNCKESRHSVGCLSSVCVRCSWKTLQLLLATARASFLLLFRWLSCADLFASGSRWQREEMAIGPSRACNCLGPACQSQPVSSWD